MGYRRPPRNRVEDREWREWLRTRSNALAALPLPLDLYSSREAWDDFLATGSAVIGAHDQRREFEFNDLTLEEQKRLHAFLEEEFGTHEPPPGLLRFLRVRAHAGWVLLSDRRR